jgi:hypothetical protein
MVRRKFGTGCLRKDIPVFVFLMSDAKKERRTVCFHESVPEHLIFSIGRSKICARELCLLNSESQKMEGNTPASSTKIRKLVNS